MCSHKKLVFKTLICIFLYFYNDIYVYIYAPPAPEVPFIVQAYSKNSDSITVEFGQVTGATGYILRAETDDGFFFETAVQSSPGTMINLQPYTQYTLSVMSVNSGGRSQPSLSMTARTGKLSLK